MATAKKNKDGLIGGSLVSQQDHLRIMTEKRTKERKAAKLEQNKEHKSE